MINLKKHAEKGEDLNSECHGDATITGYVSTIFAVSFSSPERCFQASFSLAVLSTDNRAKESWTITAQNT